MEYNRLEDGDILKKLINLILSMCSIIVLFCITFTYSKTHACTYDDFYNLNTSKISNETEDNINLTYLPENAPDGNSTINFMKYNDALNVVIHELLHSIGLDHTESSNTSANISNVMYYSNHQYKKFGAFDIASYRKLWG